MDILVCVPRDKEEHVRAEKLNPANKQLTHGFWTFSGAPRYTRRDDCIWFAIYGEVFASARILEVKSYFPKGGTHEDDEPEDGQYIPAVMFKTESVLGHEFSVPRGLPPAFRGFRYVRRADRYVQARQTKGLEVVGAQSAKKLFPKSW